MAPGLFSGIVQQQHGILVHVWCDVIGSPDLSVHQQKSRLLSEYPDADRQRCLQLPGFGFPSTVGSGSLLSAK